VDAAGATGDDMPARLALAAIALAAAPSAFAQDSQTVETQEASLPLFYSSVGLAWSGELGLEVEAGLQWKLGDALRLSLSPANISLFDGDIPDGFYWDGEEFGRSCREFGSGNLAFDDECEPEPDAEWRSVAEAQLRVTRGFHIGAGVSYILQGDFTREDGRVAPFASFAWDMDDGLGLELRASDEYVALQLRGVW